jgi:acetyl esterase
MIPVTREEAIALLDPELIAYLDRPVEDLGAIPLPQARLQADANLKAMGGPVVRAPEIIEVKGVLGEPDCEVRVHRPLNIAPRRAVLHVHGGGMVKGSAQALDGRMCDLASMASAVVVSVEYRLAPETPFPGPMLDCVAAWQWMLERAGDWGLTAAQCLMAGDSAGGGLAAATTLYLRDTGAILPAGQVLVYPMLDYLTGQGSEKTDTRLGWTSANNQFGWRALLGDQDLPTGNTLGHYSPSHAPNLSGLPPTWMGVGTIDLFWKENVAFAARLAQAGREVTLCEYEGAPHGFPSIASGVSRRFYADYVTAFQAMVP